MEDPIEIATFATELAARTAIAHLAAEDIEAVMLTDNAGGTIPSLSPLGVGVRVLVRRSDADEARAVLETELPPG
ncbi:MAG: DUF2007 domain-containing protein [Acidimicrobiia bacterium]|nr:DUF2007 domain-containing protein [Acidimicrobiia bacterium]